MLKLFQPDKSHQFHNDLVFDIGMHVADDTEIYLAQGYRVVAVEANPALCANAKNKFKKEISEGRLSIENIALVNSDETSVSFFINQEISAWSSVNPDIASRGFATKEITVPAFHADYLTKKHGVPIYAKCDIEGMDHAAATQLATGKIKPRYLSVENPHIDILGELHRCGYKRFKIVNQAAITPKDSSGPFGEFAPGAWLDYREAAPAVEVLEMERLEQIKHQKFGDWFDLHAAL